MASLKTVPLSYFISYYHFHSLPFSIKNTNKTKIKKDIKKQTRYPAFRMGLSGKETGVDISFLSPYDKPVDGIFDSYGKAFYGPGMFEFE